MSRVPPVDRFARDLRARLTKLQLASEGLVRWRRYALTLPWPGVLREDDRRVRAVRRALDAVNRAASSGPDDIWPAAQWLHSVTTMDVCEWSPPECTWPPEDALAAQQAAIAAQQKALALQEVAVDEIRTALLTGGC